MRTKLISFILLSFILSENEAAVSDKIRSQILEKKQEIQPFVIPAKLKDHPDWLALKVQHDLEIRQLRKDSKNMSREKFREKYLNVRKRQKEEKYQLVKKLNQ